MCRSCPRVPAHVLAGVPVSYPWRVVGFQNAQRNAIWLVRDERPGRCELGSRDEPCRAGQGARLRDPLSWEPVDGVGSASKKPVW
jgi:hypothetical protein